VGRGCSRRHQSAQRGEPWQAAFDAVADDLRAALSLSDGDLAARLARSLGHLTFARRFFASAGALRAAEYAVRRPSRA
jgi:hypothetical protein